MPLFRFIFLVTGLVFTMGILKGNSLAQTLPDKYLSGDMAALDVNPPPVDVDKIVFLNEKGEEKSIVDYAGKILVVNLWATWCAPCRKEMPDLSNLQKIYGSKGLKVLALNEDRINPAAAQTFLEDVGAIHLDFYRDKRRSAMLALGVRGLPATIIFDRQGQQVARLIGPADWDGGFARAVFDYLLDKE